MDIYNKQNCLNRHLKTLTLFLVLGVFSSVYGQNQNNQWYFGFNSSLDFNTVPPSSPTGNQMQTQEGSASVADSTTGDLLFYTDGITVWTANNSIMPNGTGLLGGLPGIPGNFYSSTAAAIIVPRPFTPNIYYIFTIDQENSTNGLNYSVVDMTLNGGLGDIIATQKNIPLLNTLSEKLHAVPRADGCGYWLITTDTDGDNFIVYSIRDTGIDTTPVLSPMVPASRFSRRGNIKVNPQFNKIALGNNRPSFTDLPRIELYDFDANTGSMSNSIVWDFPQPLSNTIQGVEFSPDGTKLYITPSFMRIIQYDIASGNPATIAASFYDVSQGVSPFTVGNLQFGPDNRIYASAAQGLAVINNPNNAGPACNFQTDPIAGLQGDTWYGLPQKIYELSINVNSNSIISTGNCITDAIPFSLQNTTGIVSVSWDFGDPASGASNLSSSLTPSHTFSSTGTFTVQVDITYACTTLNLTEIVTIINTITPTFDALPDICAGGTAPVLATTSLNGVTGTWSPATVDNTASATYTFTPDAGQCATVQTLTSNVTASITPTFGALPDICQGGTVQVLATTSLNGVTGTWSPATVDNTASATYTFTPDAGQCATVQTLTSNVTTTITPNFGALPEICAGGTAPTLATTSLNGVTGTWSPATVDNTASATYTFTPDAGQCATVQTLTSNVTTTITPNFGALPEICAGGTAPTLATTSLNGVTGTWSPATVDNMASATYTFTPDAGQCATVQTLTSNVTTTITPNFGALPEICAGGTAPTLATTSLNGVTGTWSPATVDNTASATYTFTPDAGQCATVQTLTSNVTTTITPNFGALPDICAGGTAPTLATTSLNGITGTWSPATVDNTASATYTFTPDTGPCQIENFVLEIQVLPVSDSKMIEFTYQVIDIDSQFGATLEIDVKDQGVFNYQLDDSPVQLEPIFSNVSPGSHIIRVGSANTCSSTFGEKELFILNYPNFFTPNGDGVNDTWNIPDLSFFEKPKILIFDRYGKLIKQLSPFEGGWDGTYNNRMMPSTDYWFLAEYEYQNKINRLKANFSLKR